MSDSFQKSEDKQSKNQQSGYVSNNRNVGLLQRFDNQIESRHPQSRQLRPNPTSAQLESIQAKYRISNPGDKEEQAADQVSNHVMRMEGDSSSLNPDRSSNALFSSHRQGRNDSLGQSVITTKRISPNAQSGVASNLGTSLNNLDSRFPLNRSERNFYEPRFGEDLSDVRIHNGGSADDAANSINAKAFTKGNDVVFAKGEYNPSSSEGKKLMAHELTHVIQQRGQKNIARKILRQVVPETGNVKNNTSPASLINTAYEQYNNDEIGMLELADRLLPYTATHTEPILAVFENLPFVNRDNLAFALANKSSDAKLARYQDAILDRMIEELGHIFNTTSWDENWEMKERLISIRDGSVSTTTQTDTDLEFLRAHFNNNLTGGVGIDQPNAPLDVKLVARGLFEKQYVVPDAALDEGVCSVELIDTVIQFQQEVVGMEEGDGIISPTGTTILKLFDKVNNSYSSGLANMYGQWASQLNRSIEGNPLASWGRVDTLNSTTQQYDYTIRTGTFISQETYLDHINELATAKGVEENSANERALGMAARAASEPQYFNEITQGIGFQLVLENETFGSHQVNSILKDRLIRFHKFISAIGMFRGNMSGNACRSESYAHRIATAHVIVGNVRPAASKESVRNNLISVYNGTAVAGGTKTVEGNIVDSDGHIWAKPEHFNLDEDQKATSLKDDVWFPHLKSPQPDRNWNTYTAEGYSYNNIKRFPLGLTAEPNRSKHISGDAIDINDENFVNMNDAMIDLIALNFGLIRPVPDEQWHFEVTNVELSDAENNLVEQNSRESTSDG